MPLLRFDINADAVKDFAGTLQEMHRSALPVVVRQTLNKAALDVKTNTMPKEAQRFQQRKANFFKANSKAVLAQGFDIGSMRSTVGFVPKENDKSHAVEDLEQQEHGGQIGNRAFIALSGARVGGSENKMVREQNRMGKIKNTVNPHKNAKGKNEKQRFVLSAIHAGKGGLIYGTDKKNGAGVLLRINKIGRKDGKTFVKTTMLYNVEAGREITPGNKYRHFMEDASMASQKKMQLDFIRLGTKKIAELIAKRK